MALQKAVRLDNATAFKFENAGDTLKGYYIQTTVESINGQPVKKHVFQTTEGARSVLGQADLYKQLVGNKCESIYIEATFTGQVQKLKGGKTMKLYDLSFDPTDRWAGEVVEAGEPNYSDDGEETALDADETPMDEVAPARPTRAASSSFKTQSPTKQAQTAALLSGRK